MEMSYGIIWETIYINDKYPNVQVWVVNCHLGYWKLIDRHITIQKVFLTRNVITNILNKYNCLQFGYFNGNM